MSDLSAIEIANQYAGVLPVSLRQARQVCLKILKKAGFKNKGISLLLVGDRRMRTLNRRFLQHDWTTDVITFQYDEGCGKEAGCLGEIIISVDTAKSAAREFGHSAGYELCFYICHGILHLAGYDDNTSRKRAAMLKKQEEILKQIRIKKG